MEYDCGKFGVGTHLTYFGKIVLLGYGYANTYPPEVALDADPNILVPEQFNYHGKMVTDLYLSYKFSRHVSASIGVDNLFDRDPPFYLDGSTNSVTNSYDYIGRFFYFKVLAKF